MRRWIELAACLLVVSSCLLAFSNLPPTRSTGGFGESTCAACHTGAAVNTGSGTFRIEGLPAQYTPGATIPLTVTMAQTGQRRWGFELAARVRATGEQAGSFAVSSGELAVRVTTNVWYVAQTSSGRRDGVVNGPVSWTLNWTAPANAVGEILFTAAGLAADGDGTERGDFTYTAQALTRPAGAIASPLPAKPVLSILPHMARGGGYVTRLLLANLWPSSNQVQINTVAQDGHVVESLTMTLPPGGSYMSPTSEAQRFAAEIEIGWVAIGADAPLAVSLLLNLHNPTTRNLQTAVAILESEPQTLSTAPFRYRPDGVTMGLAVVNLAEVDNTIALKLLDEQGNIVGDDTVVVAPFAQSSFVVSDRPRFNEFLRGRTEFLGSLSLAGTQRFASAAVGAEGMQLFSVSMASGAAH